MAVITRILAFAPLALLTLGGCSNDAQKWIGTWEGNRHGMVQKELENTEGGRTLRKIQIKIQDNGRFEKIEAGTFSKGETHFSGNRVSLKTMAYMDRALEGEPPNLWLQWQEDGTVLYYDGVSPQPEELTKLSETEDAAKP